MALGDFNLFMDDVLIGGGDWLLHAHPAPVKKISQYLMELDKLFVELENLTGMQTIIAGHPSMKADSNYNSQFGNRKVLFGCSANLAIQSKLVLGHRSTSLSFAVMARRPIIFLTSDEILTSLYGANLVAMRESVGGPLINISRQGISNEEIGFAERAVEGYFQYEKDYICNTKNIRETQWTTFVERYGNISKVDPKLNI